MVFWKKKADKKENAHIHEHNGKTCNHDHSKDHEHKHEHKSARPEPAANAKPQMPGLSKVKNIIAVASGKGGVGKSSVSINLALALKNKGYSVGLLDADIYGPSQSAMTGTESVELKYDQGALQPVDKDGLKFISMGVVASGKAPVVWRAPMAMKMISQFLNVAWGELDYLIIDLPPGTGDVQITLSQQAHLSGAVIVSTPQQVALDITRKGLSMFQQVKVPILGIIENMSGYSCPHCNEVSNVFKKGGGEKMAEELGVPFLGCIPLDPVMMEACDDGDSLFSKYADSGAAKAFLSITENVETNLKKITEKENQVGPKNIDVDDLGNLKIIWHDRDDTVHSPYDLRLSCACASCIDENTGKKVLQVDKVPLDIKIDGVRPVGRYGLSIHFSDGHNTGIYKFDTLRQISEKRSQASTSFTV